MKSQEAWRLGGYEAGKLGAWTLFKLIEFIGFIKLIGLNSLGVGLLEWKFKVEGQKLNMKRK